jgi:hypothetical protein
MNQDQPQPDLAQMNRRLRYYYKNKDKPEFRQKISEAKKDYYQRNKDFIKARTLARYYELKGVPNPHIEPEQLIEPM